jgi:ubiquinone biosynthesis protein
MSNKVPLKRILVVATAAVVVLAGAAVDRVIHPKTFEARLARRVRRAFERLGPTFVKVGQLMSSSPGSLPAAWVDEMARCRDRVPAAPWESVGRMLEDELGERIQQLVDIDHEPLAAGSMAQVHVARLQDGTPVVVKVQRPGLDQILAGDMELLRTAARWVARFSRTLAAADPMALVDDFAASLHEQLSFRNEAANSVEMRIALGSLPVRVPELFRQLSTDRVLVMERLEGIAGWDLEAIESNGIDRGAVVRTIIATLIQPAVRAGVFHADMHCGNMLVMADGHLGLFDFGVVRRMDPATRSAASELLDAVVNRRFGDAAMAIFRTIDATEIDMARVVHDVQDFLAGHVDIALADLDMRQTIGSILQLASRHRFVFPEALAVFLKQMVYVDGICRTLDPGFDVLNDAAPIVSLARAA